MLAGRADGPVAARATAGGARRDPAPMPLRHRPAPPDTATAPPTAPRPPRPGPARVLRAALAFGLATWLGTAGAATPPATAGECRLSWEVQPAADPAAGLSVRLQFDAGGRSLTNLRLPGGWAPLQPAAGQPERLQPVADDPQLRQLRHAPDERVDLRWEFRPALATQAGGALLTERWFAFTGGTVLPWPDELVAEAGLPVCLTVSAPTGTTGLVSSYGRAAGAQTQWRATASLAQWQRALFAGGAWQWRELTVPGQQVTVAMPDTGTFPYTVDALAKAVSDDLTALRKPWGAPNEAVPLLVLLLPGATAPAGLALHRTLVIQAPPSLPVPGERFDELLAAQWHRAWLPDRLGPIAHLGRGDAALRSWFTEGLADYLTHRWLLREGRWTPADYAEALNRKIAAYQALPEANASNLRVVTGRAGPEALALLPAARGEFLALTWHQALRRAGQPGLEPLLYSLVVPAAQARPEGPMSTPLATHRMLAALRRPLGDQALQWLNQHVEDGQPFSFGPQSLGPCFQPQAAGGTGAPYQALDQALERPDCQAWLKGGPAGAREAAAGPDAGSAAAAAAAGTAAATAAGVRQVCRTIAPPKPKKGAKPGKPRTVCRNVATAAASAADGADAAPAARASSRAKPATGAKPPRGAARPANRPTGTRAAAKPGSKPAQKPAAKPAAGSKPAAKPAAR